MPGNYIKKQIALSGKSFWQIIFNEVYITRAKAKPYRLRWKNYY
jgi:hypothetical protein